MKKDKNKKYLLVLLLLLFIVSCVRNDNNWIIGKWSFNGCHPMKSSHKSDKMETLAFVFLNMSADSSIIEFNKNNSFKVTSKTGKIFNEGQFKISDNTQLSLHYKNNQQENYTIERQNDNEINFISQKDSIIGSFKRITNSDSK